jgi:1,2-diacylglycerol 3-beta-glucosyltransferase
MRRIWAAVGVALHVPLAVVDAYLLTLLAAAAVRRRRPAVAPAPALSTVVLVPAHDEQDGVAATVASLNGAEVIVIADNCSDRTAQVAARAGATVLERRDEHRRGKGQALAWALDRLWAERPGVEVVAMVDADCLASPNLVEALTAAIARGAPAAQARYEVANPDASAASALRAAAFALWNNVRPMGKDQLGLSCGLLGTGMAFRRDVLERVPWRAFSVAEDAEYHARLVAAGEHVAFVPEASVTSNMPVRLGETDQQLRWESGRTAVARAWTPRLVAAGLRARDHRAVHAGLELAIPAQSLQLAGGLAGALAAGLSGRPALVRVALANLCAQAVYVLGGLALAGAPRAAYRGLLLAPVLVAHKLSLYARILTVGGPRAWVRTGRGTAR